jgi:hypothetical protein
MLEFVTTYRQHYMEYRKPLRIGYPVDQFQPEWLLSTIERYMKEKLKDYPEGSDMEVTIPLASILEYIMIKKKFGKIDHTDIYEHMRLGHKRMAVLYKTVKAYKDLFNILLDEIVKLALTGDLVIFMNLPIKLDENGEPIDNPEEDAVAGTDYQLICLNTPDRLQNEEELASILYSLLIPSHMNYIEISYNKVS